MSTFIPTLVVIGNTKLPEESILESITHVPPPLDALAIVHLSNCNEPLLLIHLLSFTVSVVCDVDV